jgi:hypothetical protein
MSDTITKYKTVIPTLVESENVENGDYIYRFIHTSLFDIFIFDQSRDYL